MSEVGGDGIKILSIIDKLRSFKYSRNDAVIKAKLSNLRTFINIYMNAKNSGKDGAKTSNDEGDSAKSIEIRTLEIDISLTDDVVNLKECSVVYELLSLLIYYIYSFVRNHKDIGESTIFNSLKEIVECINSAT